MSKIQDMFEMNDMNKNNYNLQNIKMTAQNTGLAWLSSSNKNVLFRTPLMEVTEVPTMAPGLSKNTYTVGLRVYVHEKLNKDKALRDIDNLKQLYEYTTNEGINYLLSSDNISKKYTGRVYKSKEDFLSTCKVANFFKDSSTTFYVRFQKNIVVNLINHAESKKLKQNVYESIGGDDPRKYMGVGSLLTLDLKINTFFYKGKDNSKMTFYPLSFECCKVLVNAYNENKNISNVARETKKHEMLERGQSGFSLDLPEELRFQLTNPLSVQTKVPIIPLDELEFNKFQLSKVIDGTKGPVIWAKYGDAFGPVYISGSGVLRFECTLDTTYNSRSLVFGNEDKNTKLIEFTKYVWDKLMDTVAEGSMKVFGNEYTRATIDSICSSPLYSKKDTSQSNPRVSIKVPLFEKTDKPEFDFYLIETDQETGQKSINLMNVEQCSDIQHYLIPGTLVRYVIMTRPIIVGQSIYLSHRLSQLLVEPEQDRVIAPLVDGFAFPNYDHVQNLHRSNLAAVELTCDNIGFSEISNTANKISFNLVASVDDKQYPYLIMPTAKVLYDIGLETNEQEQIYGFKIRHSLTDNESIMKLLAKMDEEIINYAFSNMNTIFGRKLPKEAVAAMCMSLVKYAKKDTAKANPQWAQKTPVYEQKDGSTNITFEAYRFIPSANNDGNDMIHKIDLKTKDNLLEVFYKDATIKTIVQCKVWFVGGRLQPTLSISQVLAIPESSNEQYEQCELTEDVLETFTRANNPKPVELEEGEADRDTTSERSSQMSEHTYKLKHPSVEQTEEQSADHEDTDHTESADEEVPYQDED